MIGEYHKPDLVIIDDSALRNLDREGGAMRMSAELVAQPLSEHDCGVNPYGVWHEQRPASPDGVLYDLGYRHYYAMVHEYDPAGTVRVCDGCGRLWVAYRDTRSGLMTTRWRPETRFERWRRERRRRRA